MRQLAKINGMTAARAADRNRHMLFAGRLAAASHSPAPQPPAKIALAIATRRAVVRADGQPHRASARRSSSAICTPDDPAPTTSTPPSGSCCGLK
jgi:hypothetical protein